MFDQEAVLDRNNGTPRSEATAGPVSTQASDPEVVSVAQRRFFTRTYKLRILHQVDSLTQPGEIGALLRAEGLYSSHLTTWRRQRESGELGIKKRGKKAASPESRELVRLRADKARLQEELEKARAIIEVQKKLSDLLGLTSQTVRKADEKGSRSHRS
jgi:transposase